MDVIVMSPSLNTPLTDVKELTNVLGYIPMCDEPECTLLQVFADVVEDHRLKRNLPKGRRCLIFLFFKLASDKVF